MLKTTLIPLSQKESYRKLTDMAEFISNMGTETVYLCHVISENYKRDQKYIDSLKEDAKHFTDRGLKTDVVIGHGPIADEVCRLADELQVEYIGIPWERKNVIKRTFLSSPDIDILRICTIPALVYKTRRYLESNTKPETILYATDCKQTDDKVLPYLKSVLVGAGELYFVHVRDRAPDPVTEKARQEELLARLDLLAAQCRNYYDHVESVIATGSIRKMIARKARQFDANLVVIGKNDKENAMNQILGQTAESMPHKIHSSVLIIT